MKNILSNILFISGIIHVSTFCTAASIIICGLTAIVWMGYPMIKLT